MKRKLIKQGLGGVTVSLPIKWVRKKGLGPGDEISIDEKEGALVLGGSGHTYKYKILEFDSVHRNLIRTAISSLYKRGYNELRIQFEGQIPLPLITELVDSLAGYEVATYDKDSCKDH